MKYVILALLGYFIGTIPCSYMVGKFYGKIDVRQHGSGNAGATNVLRTVGKKAALVALLGDVLKGVLPALIGRYFLGIEGAVLASLFAVIGHCYPVTLKFKGGKGVATAGGLIIGTNPLIAFILFIYMLILVYIKKYVSLASITAAIFYPVICYFVYDRLIITLLTTILGLLIVFKHRGNIKRLIEGKESKTTLFDKNS